MPRKLVDWERISTSGWPFSPSMSTTWGSPSAKAWLPITRPSDPWRPESCRPPAGLRNWAYRPTKRLRHSVPWKLYRERPCPMSRNEPSPATPQSMVEEFHRVFDILVQQTPGVIDERTRTLRQRLIHEEFEELKEAMATHDLTAIAKELADLLYVVYGTEIGRAHA